MNKHEVIKELMSKSREIIFGDDENVYLSRKRTIELVSQIHEPQRVVVPKLVAEWLKEYRYVNTLLKVLNAAENERIVPSAVNDWILDNQRDFVIAWLDGYEVEKEQLYTVEIPNNGGTLILACINHAIKLVDGNKHLPGKFTKESIEYAGFDWALKWAKPVEVE
ncbi:DUF1642 domain-containing protein [Streptococcus suis]|uniref:DUF1642 domain-containing protein n=1 Tax=Streptococcus suis TaxID=1307 RepID=UPI00069A1E96|nr:DUF1642 domain-containing protein [Streptococcus suis]NQP28020.1 DUF1642 domain-containing protein [Streptococcus suis]NQP39305.1 DUF1642 domain-containing protein [Streptococcus suis]NQP43445.1 DUF1642 domain-containing protein [Streptococcus suis]NQP45249.1 DUF1642 domain-containing protein [Streptococcus suis]NQP45546.1 DUF1642 domain-containing protein [Streptococcus suis]